MREIEDGDCEDQGEVPGEGFHEHGDIASAGEFRRGGHCVWCMDERSLWRN